MNKSAGKIISELSKASHAYFQHEFKAFSIGHAQITTLLYISQNKDVTQREISAFLNLDKSSITSQLNILESNRYIKRQTSEKDARVQQIQITPKAEKLIPALKQVLASWTETLLANFDKNERTKLFEYLERMQANVKQKIDTLKAENVI